MRCANAITDLSNTDAFEADSEGSDNDNWHKHKFNSKSTDSDEPQTIMTSKTDFKPETRKLKII